MSNNKTVEMSKKNMGWYSFNDILPPEGKTVKTKIDDEKGVRNEQELKRKGNLMFYPDMSMYVYYTPTHWQPIQNPTTP
jgi:hypothetical protein